MLQYIASSSDRRCLSNLKADRQLILMVGACTCVAVLYLHSVLPPLAHSSSRSTTSDRYNLRKHLISSI